MKNFNKYAIAALSLATLGFVGCESAAVEESITQGKEPSKIETITINCEPSSAETKVAIAEGWDMSWEEGEQIAGYSVDYWNDLYSSNNDNSVLCPFEASNASGNSASFTGGRGSECRLRLIYPYDAEKDPENYGKDYEIDLATVSVDPTADEWAAAKASMYMVSAETDVADGGSFIMEHLTSYLDWKFTASDGKTYNVSSVELASADDKVEFTTVAKLNLSLAHSSGSFYTEKEHGTYTIDFTSDLAVSSEKFVHAAILPFVFDNEGKINVTVYYTVDGQDYFQTIAKTNTGKDMEFKAGEFNTIGCALNVTEAVAIVPATISASVSDVTINGATLTINSTSAVELGYICEKSEDLEGEDIDADYVHKECSYGDRMTPADGAITFTATHECTLDGIYPSNEYTLYAYAKGVSGDIAITDAIIFTTESLPAMSVTEGEITATSVTFTPGYQDDYFGTIAYDCFLAEYDGTAHSASTIIGDYSNGRIYNNLKEPITIEGLEEGKEYIVRLAGKAKTGDYYTSADLKFTTNDVAATELAGEQWFDEITITSTLYNRSEITFTNDDYQIVFEFKHDVNYAPTLVAGTYELFDGEIIKLSDNTTIDDCEEESSLTITVAADGSFEFDGKILTPKVADSTVATDNKYLDFMGTAQPYFPVEIATEKALSIPADNAISFFVEDGQTSSEFGMYLELDEALSASSVTDGISVSAGYLQRYQAGEGNIIVEGECIYNISLIMFDVAYDSESGIYTLSNGTGETVDGYVFTIAQELTVDPTNVVASEVAVDVTAIEASGESDEDESGQWNSEYSLSVISNLFESLSIEMSKYEGFGAPNTTIFPNFDLTDDPSLYGSDKITVTCKLVDETSNLIIKNSEIIKVVADGDNYDITIKFESTSSNTVYVITYNGPITGEDGADYKCKLNEYIEDWSYYYTPAK